MSAVPRLAGPAIGARFYLSALVLGAVSLAITKQIVRFRCCASAATGPAGSCRTASSRC